MNGHKAQRNSFLGAAAAATAAEVAAVAAGDEEGGLANTFLTFIEGLADLILMEMPSPIPSFVGRLRPFFR